MTSKKQKAKNDDIISRDDAEESAVVSEKGNTRDPSIPARKKKRLRRLDGETLVAPSEPVNETQGASKME